MRPETRYAKSGDISIAYQVVGDGPLDFVVVPGWISNVDFAWEDPLYGEWVGRLAAFSRVILFDKRGTGLSDRDVGDSTLEERMDDLRAVLAAVGSERAAVMGFSEGGALSMLFAATYPQRVRALVLYATFARAAEVSDYPEGVETRKALDKIRTALETAWGQGTTLDLMVPAAKDDPRVRKFMGRYERMCVSPRAGSAHLQWLADIDVRPVARTLQVPTLVVHRAGDRLIPVQAGRALAREIPVARYVELPGDAHPPWMGDTAALVDEIQQFLTGSRSAADVERVLATVLFTDIVGSTERAVALGDRAWRDLLGRHHAIVRHEIERYRGREVDTTGDGFLATFDGPARAIRCAKSIRDMVRNLGIETRIGLHTGECERVDDKVAGIAVHTGARVMAEAEAGEILVSSTVKDLVAGSGLDFREHGTHTLKGIPGEWRLFAVE
jgi:class 3 adenylate cyclase/pimeloyl-ACP methyl ester carboxylesterase